MQLHELSEMLFKVQSGKIDEDFSSAILIEAEEQGYNLVNDLEHEGAVQDSEEVGGISTQFQNSFTITEVK